MPRYDGVSHDKGVATGIVAAPRRVNGIETTVSASARGIKTGSRASAET